MPSRRRVRLQPDPWTERAAGHREHDDLSAGDRRAAPERRVRVAARRKPGGRCGQGRPSGPRPASRCGRMDSAFYVAARCTRL